MPEENDHEQLPDELAEDAPIDQVRAWARREAKRRKQAEEGSARADALQRENAFLRAGVDAGSPIGQLFTKGYDGELDVDAISTAWAAVNPGAPPPPDPTGQPAGEPTPPGPAAGGLTEEQLERLQRSQGALNNDGVPPGGEPRKPLGREMMDAAFEAQGGSRARPTTGMDDRALNAGFSVLFRRAAEGDPEARFQSPGEHIFDATERWRERNS